MKSFSTTGFWWLPDHPEEAHAGTLTFSADEGPELDLLGAFIKSDPELTQGWLDLAKPPVIHGRTRDGKKVTLLRCWQTSWQLSAITTSRYRAAFVLQGTHTAAIDSLSVRSVTLAFDQLGNWLRPAGILRRVTDTGGEGRGEDITVIFETRLSSPAAEQPTAALPFGVVKLVTTADTSFGVDKVSMAEHVCFSVSLNEPQPLEVVLDNILYHLQNMITLGVGHPIEVTELRVNLSEESILRESKATATSVDLFFESTRTPGRRGKTRSSPRDMPFGYRDIAAQWPEVLSNLFGTAEVLRPVYDLYFATVYGSKLYLQNRFLNYVQAAESYHRRTSGPTPVLSKHNFDVLCERIKTVLNDSTLSIPTEVQNDFAKRTHYWNEASLRRRLKELVRSDDQELQTALHGLVGPVRPFVESVVGARNYLTHYDAADSRYGHDVVELMQNTERLGCLLRVHLMHTLGIPTNIIVRHVIQAARDISNLELAWEL